MIRTATDGDALASNSGAQIRAYVERVNALRKERDVASEGIADVLMEAKGNGFNRKALKRLADEAARPADKRAKAEADDAELELYREAYRKAGGE